MEGSGTQIHKKYNDNKVHWDVDEEWLEENRVKEVDQDDTDFELDEITVDPINKVIDK